MESILEPLTYRGKVAWQEPPEHLRLADGELHIWLIDLEEQDLRFQSEQWLSNDEKARSSRLVSQKKKADFITGRAVLRLILAKYLEILPLEIRFEYTETGKPHIAGRYHGVDIRFNLSHSGHWMLLGICEGTELGIDIEEIRSVNHAWALSHLFSAEEIDDFNELHENEKDLAFISAWTKKEAAAKAGGEGLAESFKTVQRRDLKVNKNLYDGESIMREDSFRIIQFEPAPGFLAVAAMRSPEEPILKYYGYSAFR